MKFSGKDGVGKYQLSKVIYKAEQNIKIHTKKQNTWSFSHADPSL